MSTMSLSRLPQISLPHMSLPLKLSVVGASLSIALIGALAMVFRRKRKKPPKPCKGFDSTDHRSVSSGYSNHITNNKLKRAAPSKSPSHGKNSNGDVVGHHSWSPSVQKSSRSGSTTSIKSDAASTSTLTICTVRDSLTAEELCDLGLEYLQAAIRNWEDAVEKIDDTNEDLSPQLEALQDQLHELIGRAYHMRDLYEQRLFHHVSTAAALDAAIQEMDKEYDERKRRSTSLSESSDQDSFVSALEVIDLSDLELQKETHQNLALYEAALLELTHGSIPCRTLRTQDVMVSSDTEFLAKLYCIRLAFNDIFSDDAIRLWFTDLGRQIITDILIKADRDPEEFQTAYDDMVEYINSPSNWSEIEDELRGRGVKVMSFYDIVIDFLLFDAFDDLDNPPSSLTTVIQNRWLSNGFKETALATAVWSVLKAKRRMLKYSKGFIAHFYAISEHVTPVLAWGFLGPSNSFKDLCIFFKEQVLRFMRDVFSFQHSRYTLVEHLSEDILKLSQLYADTITARLSS